MMKNVTKTNNKTALLAILAVFAMIAAGAAVVMADSSEGATTEVNVTKTITSAETIEAAGNYAIVANAMDYTVTVKGAASAAVNLYLIPTANNAGTVTIVTPADAVTTTVLKVYVASAIAGSTTKVNAYPMEITTTMAVSLSDKVTPVIENGAEAIKFATQTLTPANGSVGKQTFSVGTAVVFYGDGSTVVLAATDTFTIGALAAGYDYTVQDKATSPDNVMTIANTTDVALTGGLVFTGDFALGATFTTNGSVAIVKGTLTGAATHGLANAKISGYSDKDARGDAAYNLTAAPVASTTKFVYGSPVAAKISESKAADAGSAIAFDNVSGTFPIEYTKTGEPAVTKTWTITLDKTSVTATPNVSGVATIEGWAGNDINFAAGQFTTAGAISAAGTTVTVGPSASLDVTAGANFLGNIVLEAGAEFTSATIATIGGNVTVGGNATFTTEAATNLKGNVTVESGATMTVGVVDAGAAGYEGFLGDIVIRGTLKIGNGTSIVTGKSVDVYGKIIGAGANSKIQMTSASAVVAKTMHFKTYSGSSIQSVSITTFGDGQEYITIDLDGATSDEYLKGTVKESRSYGQTANVIVDGDLEIINNAVITIEGTFVINEGVKVTISEGALLINSVAAVADINGKVNIDDTGRFNVQSAKAVSINGTVLNDGSMYLSPTSNVTVNDGGVLTTSEGKAKVEALTVAAGGKFNVYGVADLNDAAIKNSGSVVLDGAVFNTFAAPALAAALGDATNDPSAITISMMADGAVVDVKSYTVSASDDGVTTLTITDANLEKPKTVEAQMNSNTIVLSADNTVKSQFLGLSGITFTESTSTYTFNSKVYQNLSIGIDGAAAIKDVKDNGGVANKEGKIQLDAAGVGKTSAIKFADGFVFGESITLDVDTNLTVTDDLYFSKAATIADDTAGCDIVVEGTIVLVNTAYMPDVNTSALRFTLGAGDAARLYVTNVENAVDILENYADDISLTLTGTKLAVKESTTVPSNIRMTGTGTLTVGTSTNTSVELALESGATTANGISIVVLGTLYAENAKDVKGTVTADVKTTTGENAKWTNIYEALDEAIIGETIEVTTPALAISKNVTVPAGVILKIPAGTVASVVVANKVTITVDGILMCPGITGPFAEEVSKDAAVLVVNGTFMTTEVPEDATMESIYDKYLVAGVYYQFVNSDGNFVVVEGLADAMISDATAFYVYGKVSEYDEVIFAGKVSESTPVVITVDVDAQLFVADLDLAYANVVANGAVSGAISGLTGDGTTSATVAVTKFTGNITNTYASNKYALNIDDIYGTVTIVEGTVTAAANMADDANSAFTVLSGATFAIPSGKTVTLENKAVIAGTVEVLGKLVIDSDEVTLAGDIDVKKTTTATGQLDITDFSFIAGTIDVADGAKFNVRAILEIGIAPDTTGAGATIVGNVDLDPGMALIVYPGADVSEMLINQVGDESFGVYTAFEINGDVYMVVYTNSQSAADISDVIVIPDYEIAGLKPAELRNLKNLAGWGLTADAKIGVVDEIDKNISSDVVWVKVSWDTGMSLYIDNVRVTESPVQLDVGTHTVMVKVNPGYKYADGATPSITFNGRAITGLLVFEITADMAVEGAAVPVLSATADIVVDEQPIPEQKEKDDTMMIILLAILVIMIAILIVVVILRMMRS